MNILTDEEPMLKRDEISNPDSCLNRAHDDEEIFVLLARDQAAPAAIRAWCAARWRSDPDGLSDEELNEAFACAERMEQQQAEIKARPPHEPRTCIHAAADAYQRGYEAARDKNASLQNTLDRIADAAWLSLSEDETYQHGFEAARDRAVAIVTEYIDAGVPLIDMRKAMKEINP